MLSTIALVPLSQLSEALKVVTDFAVVTKCDRTPILKYFMKTWINDKYNPDTWNYYDHIGRKTNNDVEGFNHYLNKFLHSPHPNIYKFVDHIKTIDADMVLKTSEFKRNPQDITSQIKK